MDWGEDLPRLGPWLREHGIERAYLVYPWPAPPAYYDLGWMEAVAIPEFALREPEEDADGP